MKTTEAFNQPTAPVPVPHSPWHTPVPYLFGGLAVMLGLIALSLLFLACSYCKFSDGVEGGSDSSGAERDIETGNANSDDKLKAPPVLEEQILVIMAGQEKPTFLATPIASRASSLASNTCSSERAEKSEAVSEKPKEGRDDQVQDGNTVTHETAVQVP